MNSSFYTEKGCGREIAGLSRVRSGLLTSSSWYWNSLIGRLRRDWYKGLMKRPIEISSGGPQVLLQASSFSKVPALDTERPGADDSVLFLNSGAD